jgi:hypothetical protein
MAARKAQTPDVMAGNRENVLRGSHLAAQNKLGQGNSKHRTVVSHASHLPSNPKVDGLRSKSSVAERCIYNNA